MYADRKWNKSWEKLRSFKKCLLNSTTTFILNCYKKRRGSNLKDTIYLNKFSKHMVNDVARLRNKIRCWQPGKSGEVFLRNISVFDSMLNGVTPKFTLRSWNWALGWPRSTLQKIDFKSSIKFIKGVSVARWYEMLLSRPLYTWDSIKSEGNPSVSAFIVGSILGLE